MSTEIITIVGIDTDGYKVADCDGFRYRLTPCCHASTKGTDGGVVCRSCYYPSEPEVELPPTEIVQSVNGDGLTDEEQDIADRLEGWQERQV